MLAVVLMFATCVVSCPIATPKSCSIWESSAGVGTVPIVVGVLEAEASCHFPFDVESLFIEVKGIPWYMKLCFV